MHFRFYRKSAKGSEEVEKAMDQLQAQIREEAYGKRLNLAKDEKKKKKDISRTRQIEAKDSIQK